MRKPFLHTETTRHGKTIFYFRRGKGVRIRLPDISSKEFEAEYRKALLGLDVGAPPKELTEDKKRFIRTVELICKTAVYRAKSRAEKKGMEFSLSYKWAMETIRKQSHRCVLTGIYFDHSYEKPGTMNPYMPSVDRIDCSKGYTPENCRLIISAMNIMLSDWGIGVFEDVVRGYRSYRKQRNPEPASRNPEPLIIANENNALERNGGPGGPEIMP